MPAKDLILDPASIDQENVIADIDAIRQMNPQRFEMEQLSGILLNDSEAGLLVAFKDTSEDDFWVRGHMPGLPLMPGVLMCEAAAQACGFQASEQDLGNGRLLGFGGLDDVRFRGPVKPGDRLLIVVQRIKFRLGRMFVYRFQCFVGETMVCEGKMRGVPLPSD